VSRQKLAVVGVLHQQHHPSSHINCKAPVVVGVPPTTSFHLPTQKFIAHLHTTPPWSTIFYVLANNIIPFTNPIKIAILERTHTEKSRETKQHSQTCTKGQKPTPKMHHVAFFPGENEKK